MDVHQKTGKEHVKREKVKEESETIHSFIQQISIEYLWKIEEHIILRKQEVYIENAAK